MSQASEEDSRLPSRLRVYEAWLLEMRMDAKFLVRKRLGKELFGLRFSTWRSLPDPEGAAEVFLRVKLLRCVQGFSVQQSVYVTSAMGSVPFCGICEHVEFCEARFRAVDAFWPAGAFQAGWLG